MLAGGTAELNRGIDVAAGPPSAVFDRVDVSQAVAKANPTLSSRETERVASAVIRYSEKYDLAPDLVTAILVVESGARPWARSAKGAMGLMQVMPHMLNPMGLAGNPTTIETNIEAGCFILAENIDRWGEERGISAYFWGTDVRGLGYLERVKNARYALQRSPTT